MILLDHAPKCAGTTFNWSFMPALFGWTPMLIPGSEMPVKTIGGVKRRHMLFKEYVSGHGLLASGASLEKLTKRDNKVFALIRNPELVWPSIVSYVERSSDLPGDTMYERRMNLWRSYAQSVKCAIRDDSITILLSNTSTQMAQSVVCFTRALGLPIPIGPNRNVAPSTRRSYFNESRTKENSTLPPDFYEIACSYLELEARAMGELPDESDQDVQNHLFHSRHVEATASGYLVAPTSSHFNSSFRVTMQHLERVEHDKFSWTPLSLKRNPQFVFVSIPVGAEVNITVASMPAPKTKRMLQGPIFGGRSDLPLVPYPAMIHMPAQSHSKEVGVRWSAALHSIDVQVLGNSLSRQEIKGRLWCRGDVC